MCQCYHYKAHGSIVDGVCVETLLAFIEDRAALVDRSGLHNVVFHFRVVAFRTSFLDYHFCLSSFLFYLLAFVLVQPVLVFPYVKLSLHDLSCIDYCLPVNS